jgi:hypothetical protein
MLASTALVAVGFASSASAQSVIDTSDGSMTVAAGLDGFVSATSQISTGTDVTAEVTAADSQINQTDLTNINTNQTIFGDAATAVARLNQGTNTLTISAPEDIVAGTPTGSTEINESTDVTINAATGILSQQNIIGDVVGGNVTAATGATGAPVTFSITLDSPIVSGNVINSGNEAVADALANDVMNTLTVTGPGNGSLDSPAAIANLQTITPGDDPDFSTVTADTFGDVFVVISDANGASAISGNIGLDQNTIAARAAANTAVNDLFAGSADSTAQGSLTGTLVSTGVETGGAIGGFVADFGIANLQMIEEGTADADNLEITSTVSGNVAFGVDAAVAAITSDEISLRGNSILSDAAGNTATNRGIVTTSGVNGVSVGVASLQEFEGDGTPANDVTATVTSGTVSFGGNVQDSTTAAGELTGVGVTLSDNEIGAAASGNEALNVAAVTSTGSLDGSQSYVAGRQVANEVGVSAVTTAADIVANVIDADTASTMVLNNNAVFSTAALNTQTNVLQNSGASNLGRATMVSTSQQEITGGSSSALVTASTIAAIGTTDSLATGTLTGNTVLASATGNVSTSSITNRSSGFSFSR